MWKKRCRSCDHNNSLSNNDKDTSGSSYRASYSKVSSYFKNTFNTCMDTILKAVGSAYLNTNS